MYKTATLNADYDEVVRYVKEKLTSKDDLFILITDEYQSNHGHQSWASFMGTVPGTLYMARFFVTGANGSVEITVECKEGPLPSFIHYDDISKKEKQMMMKNVTDSFSGMKMKFTTVFDDCCRIKQQRNP